MKRTIYCGQPTMQDVGKEVTVAGWVQRRRDLGNLLFLDLRDRTGIVQLAFDDRSDREIFEKANACRSEFVLLATGIVRERESKNASLETGDVEIFVSALEVLSEAKVPPFEILDETAVNEELRLTYRYLDLRRPSMQKTILARHKIVKAARDYFDSEGFLEIETPMLIRSTPEGARDYLVPSRVHGGSFYALPQSPQLYKQMLMLSGFDRYMQIARCFRDEDLRADRQPEFTQIDLEMSFVEEDDVMAVNEGFMKFLFKQVLDLDLKTPFDRLSYQEAMDQYGSDKPDVRFDLKLIDLADCLQETSFQVFAGALKDGGVRGINAKGAADKLSRKEIDKLTEVVKTYGGKGLAFTRLAAEKETSSYEKFLSDEEKAAVRKKMGAQPGDLLLLVADSDIQIVYDALGALRCHLAKKLDLIPKDSFAFLWVTDFPLLEYNKEEERFVAKHHPFTAVADRDLDKLETCPQACHAKAYDLVLNGCEVGGGSIRIHRPDVQQKMFAALGFSQEQAKERFGFLMEAFAYGAPPHGGMAYGLDRLVMLMLDKTSIRDVIAFPKVQNARELMVQSPSEVEQSQLADLHIQVVEES